MAPSSSLIHTTMDDSASQKSYMTVMCTWLSPSSSDNTRNSVPLEEEETKRKEIRACLDGENVVNLWALREFALSKGGLLSIHVRKRAWPKLMSVHQQVLLHSSVAVSKDTDDASTSSSTTTRIVEITQQDMEALQHDLSQPTMWNIEQHMSRNLELEKQVTFLPGLTSVSPTPSIHHNEEETSAPSNHNNDSGTISPMTNTTTTPPSSDMYASTSIRVPALRLLTRSPQECTALQNTILCLLRTVVSNNNVWEWDDRHHYYHGLDNLTSLFLIVLQSPSLTCLLLQQLAKYSLCDYLRGTRTVWQPAVTHLSTTLLVHVDKTLFQHLVDWDQTNVYSQRIVSWIPSWFTCHIHNLALASRLVDVFLVSHATMPIYISVALTCHYRQRLLQASDPVTLQRALCQLPKQLVREAHAMDVLEDIIATAIDYIRLFPPQSLVSNSNNSNMFQELLPPQYAMACLAPTDWALLQQAKALRMSNGTDKVVPEEEDNSVNKNVSFWTRCQYPLAVAALGQCPTSKKSGRRGAILMNLVVVVVLTAAGMTTMSMEYLHNTLGITEPACMIQLWKRPTNDALSETSFILPSFGTRSKTAATPSSASRRMILPFRTKASPTPRQTTYSNLLTRVIQWNKTHIHKNKVFKWMDTAKEWKREHINKENLARLATKAIVEGDKLRWKGQRFLL